MKILCLLSLSFILIGATDLENFALSSNEFASEIYSKLLNDNKDNLLVSPFSVETVLALTQSGAFGDTGSEIRAALHLPDTKDETDDLMKQVLPEFVNEQYKIHIANKVYVEYNLPIRESFQNEAQNNYQATFQNIDFANSAEAKDEINQWVEDQTEGLIKDLVSPEDIGPNTKLVLINALYFQANWSRQFTTGSTLKSFFYTTEDAFVPADIMFIDSLELKYAENEELDAQIIELPFLGNNASMVIILPRQREGINIVEKQDPLLLNVLNFEYKFVQLSLPKFKIESSINFVSILAQMGMKKSFRSTADFSGIAGVPGDLFIGNIKQKTYISVNEGGVTAAAATEVALPPTIIPPAEKIFRADHPFVFYIKVKGIVLFEGRVVVPKSD